MARQETPRKTIPCPTCKKPAKWDKSNPWRPFCSERCRLIDLGDWFEERNRIPDDRPPDDFDQGL